MASDRGVELASIDQRLEEMRADESRQWWHWYRWIGYAILLMVLTTGTALLLRHTAALWYVFGVGLALVFSALGRAIYLLRVWWPLGTEKSALVRRKYKLNRAARAERH